MSEKHSRLCGLDRLYENEKLQSQLKDSNSDVNRLRMQMAEMVSAHETERDKLKDELSQLRGRYEQLLSNHQSLSKLNHKLEESLISTIEASNADKTALSRELEVTQSRLTECEKHLSAVTDERNQYKEDCSTATALLRANPDQFLPQVCSTATATATVPRVSSSFFPTFPPVGLAMFHMDADRTDSPASTATCRLASAGEQAKSSGKIVDL